MTSHFFFNVCTYFWMPDSWAASPSAWFGIVESQSRLHGINGEADCFALVATVLLVDHLLAEPPED